MSTRDDRLIWSGPVKVVSALELEAATMEGWALLQVIRVDRVEYVSSDMFNPNKKESYESDTVSLGASAVAQDVTFLVGKTEETALAEAIQKEAESRSLLDGASQINDELEKKLCELKRKADASAELAEERMRRVGESAEKRRVEMELRRKLEADMTKVIARIGQREWDAAVGTSEGAT